jgi:peptide/nickel transport system substrate-binding protein
MTTHTRSAGHGRRTRGCLNLALVVICALLLIQPAGPTTAVRASVSGPEASGTFVIAGPDYDTATFDPALTTDNPSLLIARQIYDTLTMYQDGGSSPIPGLAESWQVSGDGLTWTFHLRSGVSFHDGTDLDAAAVAANIKRWWDPADPYHVGDFEYFQALFSGFKGDPTCLLTAVTASGSRDVVLTLQAPHGPLPSILALPAFSIASPTALAAGALATAPVGSGPFRFVQRTPGDRVTLAANPGYWGGAPRSDTLIFRTISSATDRLSALRTGEAQVADAVAAEGSEPLVRWLSRGAAILGYLGINRTRSPLDNALVRQAIAHLVDKNRLRTTANAGQGQVADQFLPPGIWGRDPGIADYSYDPALARSLLTQAGYSAGFTTTLAYRNVARAYMINPRTVAQTLKADFAQAGIGLDVLELESAEFLDRVYRGDTDLFLLGWGADYPHPNNFFWPHFCGNRPASFPRDAELCNALQNALASGDFAGQEAIYRWVSRRIRDTLPDVPLFYGGGSAIARRYDVGGVTASLIAIESYRLAEIIPQGLGAVTPESGGAVGYLQNGAFTSLQAPPGAVAAQATLRITAADATSIPAGLAATGRAFDIDTAPAALRPAGLPLARPATLTVEYLDSDLRRVNENTLALYIWNGASWTPAVETCIPVAQVMLDTSSNRIETPVCQLGRFALLGRQRLPVYAPLILR